MQIRKGDRVALSQSAANADPAKYDHPHEFDYERPASGPQHLALGAGSTPAWGNISSEPPSRQCYAVCSSESTSTTSTPTTWSGTRTRHRTICSRRRGCESSNSAIPTGGTLRPEPSAYPLRERRERTAPAAVVLERSRNSRRFVWRLTQSRMHHNVNLPTDWWAVSVARLLEAIRSVHRRETARQQGMILVASFGSEAA